MGRSLNAVTSALQEVLIVIRILSHRLDNVTGRFRVTTCVLSESEEDSKHISIPDALNMIKDEVPPCLLLACHACTSSMRVISARLALWYRTVRQSEPARS